MKSKDLTKGNILLGIITFAIPVLIGNIFQQIYNLTDTWVVGKFLEDGISAIGASNGIFDLLLAIANGMTMGFAIVIARCFGSGDASRRRKSIVYTISLTLIVTVILTIITCALMKPILRALNTPDEIFDSAYTYIIVITAGMITTMLYNMFCAMMRSAGNSLTALICLIASVILNVFMDILFVVVFKWGIFGVALATVVAQGLSALFCFLFIMFKMPELHIGISDFKIEKDLLKETFLTGLSMGFMLFIVYIGTLVQQGAINCLGQDVITAHSLARKLSSVFMCLLSTMSTTSSTFAGQNFGANKLYRIKKGMAINFILGTISSLMSLLIAYVWGKQIIMALGSIDEGETFIINTASKYLKINLPFYSILSVLLIMRTSMQALGYKVIPSLTSAIEMIVKFLITYVLVTYMGYLAICWGEPIIWTLCAIWICVSFLISKEGRNVIKSKRTEYDY